MERNLVRCDHAGLYSEIQVAARSPGGRSSVSSAAVQPVVPTTQNSSVLWETLASDHSRTIMSTSTTSRVTRGAAPVQPEEGDALGADTMYYRVLWSRRSGAVPASRLLILEQLPDHSQLILPNDHSVVP